MEVEQSPNSARTLRELARKANDRIRVYNPTKEEFILTYDGYAWPFPSKDTDSGRGKGQSVVPRYVALNYVKHLTDKILTAKKIDAIAIENERRVANGMAVMNVHTEQPEFESRYTTNSPEARREILKQLWLGVEEEYGLDQPAQAPLQKADPRSVDEQILDELDKPFIPAKENWTKEVEKDLADIPEVLEQKKADVIKGVSK